MPRLLKEGKQQPDEHSHDLQYVYNGTDHIAKPKCHPKDERHSEVAQTHS